MSNKAEVSQLVGVEKSTFNEVCEYLSKKPYNEVSAILNGLSQSKLINVTEEVEKGKGKGNKDE